MVDAQVASTIDWPQSPQSPNHDAGSDLDDDRSEEIELVDDMGVLAKLRLAIAQINFRPVKLDILRKQVTLWQQATGQRVRELRLKRDCVTRYGHL